MELKVIHPKVTGKVRGSQNTEKMGVEWSLGAAEPSESRCKLWEQQSGGLSRGKAFRGQLSSRARESGLCNMQIANQ